MEDTVRVERDYDQSGKLYRETSYKNGKQHGIEKVYWSNGQISHKVMYQNGKRHGILRAWWADERRVRTYDYYLYGKKVTQEEYERHLLIEKLSGVQDG